MLYSACLALSILDCFKLNHSTNAHRATREELLNKITQTLSTDDGVAAAWLTGSYARANTDALSDIDLSVVISAPKSHLLTDNATEYASSTTPERLAFFSQFGQPALIHEINAHAPAGGTFSFVLYGDSAVAVDWVLIPIANAQRPHISQLLFDHVGVPVAPQPTIESLDQRREIATERVSFFWLMASVVAKYIVRGDNVFVVMWLEHLHSMVADVERVIAGELGMYQRGCRTRLTIGQTQQANALRRLCHEMVALAPAVIELGGRAPLSPLPTIELILNLRA